MKILLDECISRRLKKYLEAFEVYTVVELNLSGIKNGMLLKFCVENNFDILLTIDKNLLDIALSLILRIINKKPGFQGF